MELTKIYFFFLTVLTNFSLEIFAQDTLSDYTSSTTDSSESGTLEPSTTAAGSTIAPYTTTPLNINNPLPYIGSTAKSASYDEDNLIYQNITAYDKSLLRTTESTWEPVPPSLRFGLPTNQRRGRPKCCRRVRENEKSEARKLKCKNGSIFSRDARGRRRRKCRRRNRCKTRCKAHYKNTAWSIVGTMMKGLDFFMPKLEFKFHTGTLVFGTKFFSGLVPFLQAKIQGMHFFYSLFEPLLDGVLDALDFGRMSFRSMSLDDDEDDDEEEDGKKKVKETVASSAVIVDEKVDSETVDDYDDSDILPDISMAKQNLPEDEEEWLDEEYDSPKEDEPVDEDYGIDEDWDGDDDDDDEDNIIDDQEEEKSEDYPKRITLPKPGTIVRRPLRPRPTRNGILNRIPAASHSEEDQVVIQEFMNRIKDDRNNFTVYHSNIVGEFKRDKPEKEDKNKDKKPSRVGKPEKKKPAIGGGLLGGGANRPLNDTQILNVDNLVLNINAAKPSGELYEDDVDYQEDPDWDDDKLVDSPVKRRRRVKSRPPVFSSFGAFFGAIADAFDSYFSGTY